MISLIVDSHAHVFAAEAMAGLKEEYRMYAPQLRVEDGSHVILTGDRSSGPMSYMPGFSDVGERLAVMEKMGVDVQVVSVTPGNFCYEAPVEAGRAISAAQNDAIAGMVDAHPDRFVGCATVALQDPESAAAELNRCVRDQGFRAVEIGTNIAGVSLDSPRLAPFYAEAERLGTPIIVHPINNAGAERMRNYYLGNIVGNPAESTLAVGCVVFGGILDQYPRLTFCWSHGGGFWPYQVGRFDHGYDVRPEPKQHISRHPSEYISRMYYDTITHNEGALSYLVSSMGTGNVIYGTDFPWDMGEYDSIKVIERSSLIPDGAKAGILGETSARLFGIRRGSL